MYSVFYGDVCIYNDQYPLKEYRLGSPVLSLEDNCSGAFTFDLPPTNRGYNLVEMMTPIFSIRRDGKEIWAGRAIDESVSFFNVRSITCEGELGYFNDTYQPQKEYKGVTLNNFYIGVLSEHNAKVDDNKKFMPGRVSVTDPDEIVSGYESYHYTQFEKTLETLNNLIEQYGGHLVIRKEEDERGDVIRYLDWLSDDDMVESGQSIIYGTNLIDLTKTIESTELATVILPLGKKLASSGSEIAGDNITPTIQNGYYIDHDTGEVRGDAPNSSYKIASYEGHGDLGEQTFFVSTRHFNGYGLYAWYAIDPNSGDYLYLSGKFAGTGIGSTDAILEKITAPAGARRLVIGGYGNDIPIKLNEVIVAAAQLDFYTTVEKARRMWVDENGVYHRAYLQTQAQYDILPEEYKLNGEMWQTTDTKRLYQNGILLRTIDQPLYVINEEAVERYGWIEKQITWDDVTDPDELYSLAYRYLNEEQFLQINLEITSVDMRYLGIDVEMVKLLDKISVRSSPHGIDGSYLFPVSKIELKLDKPGDSNYILGDLVSKSLTSVNNDINEELAKKIAQTPTITQTVQSAKEAAGALVAGSTGGYVTLVQDVTGDHVEEIVISDTVDYTQSTNVWRWNRSGLAHSSNGYNGTYSDVAITMDGRVVANSLAANSALINSIVSGTLRVGISGERTGAIEVYDANNHRIAAMDIGGVEAADFSTNTKRWVKLQGNSLIYGNDNEGAHSNIRADYNTILEGQSRKSIAITSECVTVDTDFFAITTGMNSGNVQVGQTEQFDIVTNASIDNDGNLQLVKKQLTFTKGILTGVVDL